MDGFIKSLTGLLPFLEQYPIWVRMLFSGWVLMSAIVIVSLVLSPHQTKQAEPDEKKVSSITERTAENMLVEFEITYPQNGDKVGPSVIVRGRSNVRSQNLYLIVIPLQTGDRYVVDGPLTVDTTGSWSGRARFGEGDKGIREHFAVSVLATRLNLSEGALETLPLDSQMSDSVEVERVK